MECDESDNEEIKEDESKDDRNIENSKKNEYFFKSKSFGIVLYREHDDSEHIPLTKQEAILGLFKIFYDLKIGDENKIEEITIGHEHGDEKNRCHFQIFLKFEKQLRKIIKPGNFIEKEIKILYIAQRCREPAKLRNYCKKDGDFLTDFPNKTIIEILRQNKLIEQHEGLIDPYDYMMNQENLSENQIVFAFKTCRKSDAKKNFVNNGKNIIETYKSLIKQDFDIPPFTWNFPEHIKDFLNDEKNKGRNKIEKAKYKKLEMIYAWFNEYCLSEGEFRRKALFLFSPTGGYGKSYFARGLVPEIGLCNSPYYVYCRGTLDASEFQTKGKFAKLVIIDDVGYIEKDMEIWKALAVGEPTNIRTPYYNTRWNKSLPCIFLSNNKKTFLHWITNDDLQNRCVFISIDFYLGPPGTENENYRKFEGLLDDKLIEEAQQIKQGVYE